MNCSVKFAEKISDKLVDKGIVPREDVALYQYGIENAVTIVGNLLASVLLGVLTGRLGIVLVFLLFYASLRSYSGGVHCKSKMGCFIVSVMILIIPVYTYKWAIETITIPVFIIMGMIAIVIILVLSPVESINKRLDSEERRYYRRISHCVVALQSCVLSFLYCLDLLEYFYAGFSSLLLVAVFMVIGKITAKHYI